MSDSKAHFDIPSTLDEYQISAAAFQSKNDGQALAVGAIVFCDNRLLLVQRSSTERAFPNCWEIPGGKCEDTDETILHGVSRELKEETGLVAKKFVRKSAEHGWGDPIPQTEKLDRWIKLVFEVEVEDRSTVTLDPDEHQQYLWATEEEIKNDLVEITRLTYISPANKDVMLDAFRLRRE